MSVSSKEFVGVLSIVFVLCLHCSSYVRRQCVLGIIHTHTTSWLALKVVRGFLGHLLPPILVNWWFKSPAHISQDGHQVLHNLKYQHRAFKYGGHHRESIDMLTPYSADEQKDQNNNQEQLDKRKTTKVIDVVSVPGLLWELSVELLKFSVYGIETEIQAERQVVHNAPVILFGKFKVKR